ncbi:MAG: hypothetical protein HC817_16450 [Saprospiraceae bacterium]|nr:hypothetical protein [Saprospiraceae bacterium]
MKAHKPTLPELVEAVKKYCAEKKRALPYFNIEIKSQPDYDNIKTPSVSTFAQLVVEALKHSPSKKFLPFNLSTRARLKPSEK